MHFAFDSYRFIKRKLYFGEMKIAAGTIRIAVVLEIFTNPCCSGSRPGIPLNFSNPSISIIEWGKHYRPSNRVRGRPYLVRSDYQNC